MPSGPPAGRCSQRKNASNLYERNIMGYGLVGILVIVLLIAMIFFFVRRA
jgi:high-affinity K+ transport system ATPase subunit B